MNVRIEYDCEDCGTKRISSETGQIDNPDEELLKLRAAPWAGLFFWWVGLAAISTGRNLWLSHLRHPFKQNGLNVSDWVPTPSPVRVDLWAEFACRLSLLAFARACRQVLFKNAEC